MPEKPSLGLQLVAVGILLVVLLRIPEDFFRQMWEDLRGLRQEIREGCQEGENDFNPLSLDSAVESPRKPWTR